MKAGHDQTQIANLLNLDKSIISPELYGKWALKDYWQKQACANATKRYKKILNAATMLSWVAEQAAC